MNKKGMIKTDCFAYRNDGRMPECNVLKELVCRNKECSFYKTVKEFKMKGGYE